MKQTTLEMDKGWVDVKKGAKRRGAPCIRGNYLYFSDRHLRTLGWESVEALRMRANPRKSLIALHPDPDGYKLERATKNGARVNVETALYELALSSWEGELHHGAVDRGGWLVLELEREGEDG